MRPRNVLNSQKRTSAAAQATRVAAQISPFGRCAGGRPWSQVSVHIGG
jgi:hypothetical protein